MKVNEPIVSVTTRKAIREVARAALAMVLGHVVFNMLEWMVPIDAGMMFCEVGRICLSIAFLCMMHFCGCRVWVTLFLGFVLWYFMNKMHIYTSPVEDPVSGHARYFGFPLPPFKSDECSAGLSVMADAKPGRSVINLVFWCVVAYALLVLPRIRWWLENHWRFDRKRFLAVLLPLLGVVTLIVFYRHEIADNWYVPQKWESPHGYERAPRHLWPDRTWWQDLRSYF